MRWERTERGLRALAPAKVNLFLEVGPRRGDGYHEIDSVFEAITLYDEIEFEPTGDGSIALEESGIAEGEKNLVVRAARALRDAALPGRAVGARIRLRKRIPAGAGLGGGSSDAAAALLALARLWEARVSAEDLRELAASLGSDVPFFLVGGIARCRGRGEIVESWAQVPGAGEPFHYVLVYPRRKLSTKEMYAALDAARAEGRALTPPSPLDSMPPVEFLDRWRRGAFARNRFEDVAYALFPELRELRDRLRREPFVSVLLSGSGSTVYGSTPSVEEAERIAAGLRERLDMDIFVASNEPASGGGLACGP